MHGGGGGGGCPEWGYTVTLSSLLLGPRFIYIYIQAPN